MTPFKLVPKTMTANAADNGDKVLAVLNRSVEMVQADIDSEFPPSGVMVIFWRTYADGTAEESWVTSGVNQLEAVGILEKTKFDMQTYSMAEDSVVEDDGDVPT